ncbi:MAG: hypothetical protein V1707_01085, partial [bacterium]
MDHKKYKILRLRDSGHSAIAYRDVVFHSTDKTDVAYRKFSALIKLYGMKIEPALEPPLATGQTKESIAYIQRRGEQCDLRNKKHWRYVLTSLHCLRCLPVNPTSLFKNNLLLKNRYDPNRVWNHFYNTRVKNMYGTKHIDINKLRQLLLMSAKPILKIQLSLIHGDLQPANIIIID